MLKKERIKSDVYSIDGLRALFREIADLYSARFHHLAEIGIVKEMSFEIDSKDFEERKKREL